MLHATTLKNGNLIVVFESHTQFFDWFKQTQFRSQFFVLKTSPKQFIVEINYE